MHGRNPANQAADPSLGWDGGNANSGNSGKKAVRGSTSLPRTAFQHSQFFAG